MLCSAGNKKFQKQENEKQIGVETPIWSKDDASEKNNNLNSKLLQTKTRSGVQWHLLHPHKGLLIHDEAILLRTGFSSNDGVINFAFH